MRLHGRPDLAVAVEPHRTYAIGPFEVSFTPSRHSRLAAGLWTPYDGELSCEHTDELIPQAYKCGQVWGIHVAVAGTTFYHHGSCNLIDGEIRHRRVDYLLARISGRHRFTSYWRLLSRLSPGGGAAPLRRLFRPLDAPFAYSLNVASPGFPTRSAGCARLRAAHTHGRDGARR
jgi:hypothetical protein